MLKKVLLFIGAFLTVLGGSLVGNQLNQPVKEQSLGSVAQSSEYLSTSTSYISTPNPVLKTDAGVLGSVVITGANTGRIDLYDATTTNKNLRTGQAPTNTIFLGSIVASQVAGTYTFDVAFKSGLYLDLTGSLPTSTITYR